MGGQKPPPPGHSRPEIVTKMFVFVRFRQTHSVGPVEAIAGKQAHPAVPLAGDQPVTVVLDFVNPLRADRRLCCSGRDARLDIAEPLCGPRRHAPEVAARWA
jgi:hypothetical protein